MTETKPAPELVTVTIDGKHVKVPKGTNLIDAAKQLGIEIPYYCYHPHLSVAGNCRMCQVKVKGAPKMDIACNTSVREGMEVQTQESSPEVAATQAAVLEFILANHPLDCTVCDQAGHCKLQDYHYEYNARSSRFLEQKEHKVKALPLGPTVMLDGERCIMCTRCIRFCDEVTKTSELGMLNRGDRSVISINKDRQLDNPLSGTVVDLCPVGALTHREWRFNTRIWFTRETDTICPGCSTGCNARVAVRDRQVVQVKGRLNSAVNKEWMCDEGRYGFGRFLPENRITASYVAGKETALEDALKEAKKLAGAAETVVLLAPDLLVEDFASVRTFLSQYVKNVTVAVAYRERALTPVQSILMSPDTAANFRAAEFTGLIPAEGAAAAYAAALEKLRAGQVKQLLLVGDRSVLSEDVDALLPAIRKVPLSVAILADAGGPMVKAVRVLLPGRTVLERAGLYLNRALRLQYGDRAVDFPVGSEPAWRLVQRLIQVCGGKAVASAGSDRDMTLAYLAQEPRLSGLSIPSIKAGGVDLKSYQPGSQKIAQAG